MGVELDLEFLVRNTRADAGRGYDLDGPAPEEELLDFAEADTPDRDRELLRERLRKRLVAVDGGFALSDDSQAVQRTELLT